MTESTQYIVQRQDPAIEAYRLGLLGDVQGYIKGQIERGDAPPDYQVAGLSPSEQAAIAAAQTGVGAYQPFLTQGSSTVVTPRRRCKAVLVLWRVLGLCMTHKVTRTT